MAPCTWRAMAAVLLSAGLVGSAQAVDRRVPEDHPSIQAAIVAASDGDTVVVGPGAWHENIDFLGKPITVVGAGADTVLHGTGSGSVVSFVTAEGPGSILDGIAVTGGNAPLGAGIRIENASPTIRRSVIIENRASDRGSGIFVGGATSAPFIHNNLVIYNGHSAGDPHAIQSDGASPRIVNNTVVRNDSNGIFLAGGGTPEVRNNVIAFNGSRVPGSGTRGRGICDFTTTSIVRYNLFRRNRVAALLRAGTDWRRIRRAERTLGSADFTGNLDANPRFRRRRPLPTRARATLADFELRATSRAVGAGDPEPMHANPDGSRNTIGHGGGPFAVRF